MNEKSLCGFHKADWLVKDGISYIEIFNNTDFTSVCLLDIRTLIHLFKIMWRLERSDKVNHQWMRLFSLCVLSYAIFPDHGPLRQMFHKCLYYSFHKLNFILFSALDWRNVLSPSPPLCLWHFKTWRGPGQCVILCIIVNFPVIAVWF